MRYHFVVNGYAEDICRQMEEQQGFAENYLSGMELGEAIIYCQKQEDVSRLQVHHAKEAVFLLAPEYVPEVVLDALCGRMNPEELYIFGADDSGIELAVRAAARLSGSSITDAEGLRQPTGEEGNSEKEYPLYVSKMVYANHMEATFAMEQGPFCISLARGGERRALGTGVFSVKEEIACGNGGWHIASQEFYPEESENGLDHAKVIVAAGRGVQKKENMAVIDEAAGYLGAEVAVSRPAAMNAWKPMNRLIGVSGAMVGSDICIAAGVSGAAAFYAGIEKSRFIVAINTDEKAPIMKMADVAVVDDFFPVMEALSEEIRSARKYDKESG